MFHPEAIPLNQVHLPILYFEFVLLFCPNFIFNTQSLYQVLPVFLKVLPLKEDKEESIAVYSCICNLVLSSNPQVLRLFFYAHNFSNHVCFELHFSDFFNFFFYCGFFDLFSSICRSCLTFPSWLIYLPKLLHHPKKHLKSRRW